MRVAAFTLLSAAFISPSFAQDGAEDWDLTTDAQQQLTLASLDFGDNVLALRCKSGGLELLLTGVPTTTADTRSVRVTAGLIVDEQQTWQTRAGLPVLSASEPDRLARQIRDGAELDIRVEGSAAGERIMRYRLPVPASARSVNQVLDACGRPLSDDWDRLSRAPDLVAWAHMPVADFPEAAMRTGVEAGDVRLGCIVEVGGDLDDCRIVSESPAGADFGAEALQAAKASRVRLPPDGAGVGSVVHFTIRFRVS